MKTSRRIIQSPNTIQFHLLFQAYRIYNVSVGAQNSKINSKLHSLFLPIYLFMSYNFRSSVPDGRPYSDGTVYYEGSSVSVGRPYSDCSVY